MRVLRLWLLASLAITLLAACAPAGETELEPGGGPGGEAGGAHVVRRSGSTGS